jgi:DNA-binding CsgD family transcriptional regulator
VHTFASKGFGLRARSRSCRKPDTLDTPESWKLPSDKARQHLDVAGRTPYGFCIETNHFVSPNLIQYEAAAMGHTLSQATIGHEESVGVVRDPYVVRPRQWAGHDRRPRLVPSAEGTPTETGGLNAADIHLLGLLAEGLPLEAVGRRLDLSDRTIRRRARSVCDRIGVRAPIQAVAWAARRGLI